MLSDLVASPRRARVGFFGAGSSERAPALGGRARQLLQLAERPTVVLCANDLTAIGLMQELQQHGVRIPQDISVAGFDDIPALQSFSPSLTTIHSPMAAMGREAVKLLLRMIEHGEHAPAEPILLPGALVVRGSVRPCCRHGEPC